MRKQEADSGIFDMMQSLGLGGLVTVGHPSTTIASYCQVIEKDFTVEQLYSFIEEKILSSELFNHYTIIPEYDNTVVLVIRNGDYLSPEKGNYHDCFDRMDFLNKAIQNPKISNITRVKVFSDDVNLCEKQYNKVLCNRFEMVDYNRNTDVLGQLKEISLFKHKILWNSTFAFWAGFIGNVIYNNQCVNIVPNRFSKKDHISTRVPSEWTIVNVIPK